MYKEAKFTSTVWLWLDDFKHCCHIAQIVTSRIDYVMWGSISAIRETGWSLGERCAVKYFLYCVSLSRMDVTLNGA